MSFLNLYCKISYPFVIRKFDMVIQKPLENKNIIVKNNQSNNSGLETDLVSHLVSLNVLD